jgi:hypothetical protein
MRASKEERILVLRKKISRHMSLCLQNRRTPLGKDFEWIKVWIRRHNRLEMYRLGLSVESFFAETDWPK